MSFRTILSPNATALERGVDQIIATRMAGIATPLRALWSAQDCPEALLPWLASSLSVENWDSSLPLSLRCARVAQAIPIHRRKGTVQSIRDVIATYGGIVSLTEWWQQSPPGVPHSFALSITLGGQSGAPSADFINSVISDVTRNKPLRSFFTFTIALNATGSVGLPAGARPAVYARLNLKDA